MAASVTLKLKDGIRFQSGNLFLVKLGTGSWEGLGHVVGGKLDIKASENSVTLADGETVAKRGSRKATFAVTLAQTNKPVLDRLFALSGSNVSAYYYNGAEDKHQEIYIPSLEVIENMSIDMKGNSHQQVVIEGSVNPADTGTASCIPNTDFPDEKKSTLVTSVNSNNPYVVIVETAIT